MRVLLLNDRFDQTGGSQIMTAGLRDELRWRGHDVRVMTSRAGTDDPATDYACFGSLGRLQTLTRTVNPSAVGVLRRALRDFDPDVVHARAFLTQLSPAILPLLAGRPAVMHAVMYDAVCPTGGKLLPSGQVCQSRAGWVCRQHCLSPPAFAVLMGQRALWRRWRGAFDAIVANSRATADKLEAEEIGPVDVVWNAVATTPPRPPLTDPPTLAVVARLSREKGVGVAIEALAKARQAVPDARLIVVGDGPLRDELTAMADRLGIASAVDFAGRVPHDQVSETVGGAWAQLVPSTWDEPFGLVAAEAMMRGTAAIVSDSGGLHEIVPHERAGLRPPPGDVDAWADAMQRVLTSRDLAEQWGSAAREHALQHFTIDRMVDRFEAIYQRVIAGRAGVADSAG